MTERRLRFISLLLVASLALPAAAAAADWPVERGNGERWGLADFEGGATMTPLWELTDFHSGGWVGHFTGGFVVSGETAYLAGLGVRAVDLSTGAKKWQTDVAYTKQINAIAPPALTPDGTLLVPTDAGLLGLGSEGAVKWRVEGARCGAATVGADDTAYMNCDKLMAVAQDGTVRWSRAEISTAGGAEIAIARDGTLRVAYARISDDVAERGGRLAAFDPATGATTWEYRSPAGGFSFGPIVVGPDGTTYFGDPNARSTRAIDASGRDLWVTPAAERTDHPVLFWGQGGKLVVFHDGFNILVIDPKTGLRESAVLKTKKGLGDPAILLHGGVFIGRHHKEVFATGADGVRLWEAPQNGTEQIGGLAVSKGGILLYASDAGFGALRLSGDSPNTPTPTPPTPSAPADPAAPPSETPSLGAAMIALGIASAALLMRRR